MSELALKLIAENKKTKNPFLDLGKCGLLNYIPKELGDCIWLKRLNLSGFYRDEENKKWIETNNKGIKNTFVGNELTILEKLSGLQSLDLSSNKISDISFLEKLMGIKSLDLSYNHISSISFIENLKDLESIDLSYNQITDVRFIENLEHLKSLDLSRNRISNYSFLKNLKHLEFLDLSGNQISNYGFLENLVSLKSLDLSRNQISNYSFLKNLRGLESLYLIGNQIKDINFLENLDGLKRLILLDNQIDDLKFLLPLLRNGLKVNLTEEYYVKLDNGIGLKNNPIKNPPIEVIKQGNDAIIRHYERLEQEGKDYIFEAKVTLVGDGGAGKTSLQRKIIDKNATLPAGDERTRGINVYDWNFIDSDNERYIAHIWDFGGQDVYYPVHRFFLTENSVYVLMASTRYPNNNFNYWIPTIYQFGGKSPIVLVQNCDEGHQKNWDEIGIYYSISDYNLCKPFYKIDLKSKDNWGLKHLKTSIEHQIINLPHIGKPVPKSWVKLREVLIAEAEKNDCISFEKFSNLCKKVDEKAFDEAVDIEDLGKFLHDLGIILWYYDKDLLKHLVILKPEWAMNAVYQIIDDTIIQEQYGIIHKADFERIWYESTYRSKIRELKSMIEVFKIAFPKKHQKEDFIIPARLLPITDGNRWKDTEQYLRLEYHFDFMPKGIVNQISAELSKIIASDNYIWNNAVIFRNDGSEAQVIEEHHFRKIFIKSKGRDARGLMLLIMHTINNVISEYRGVVPSIRVPCSCVECQTSSKPTIFQYEELIELIRKNREYITCNKSDTRQNINELLYSAGFENIDSVNIIVMDKKSISTIIEDTPEIFFSYAWNKAGETESREKIVNELYKNLSDDGFSVILDKEDLPYRESISAFINRIGDGKIIVVALSDAYLKSINCKYLE
jgi:hypothetical protein